MLVLWSRWAPDLPYQERIYDVVQEGRELREQGDDAEACQRWPTAWGTIIAVTPDNFTTLEAADDHLPNVLTLEAFLRSVDNDLATLAADDPTYHERRLEFCREVYTQFPDAPDELLLDFRHFIADSLTELGRLDESRNEFETIPKIPGRTRNSRIATGRMKLTSQQSKSWNPLPNCTSRP
jgi:hypothetical protein